MRHYYINSSSLLILSTLSCLKGGMALPACAARASGRRCSPERGAPRPHHLSQAFQSREAELAASRPGSSAPQSAWALHRGVSQIQLPAALDEPLKASSSLGSRSSIPLFAFPAPGLAASDETSGGGWDLGSSAGPCSPRGLAALSHSLKHVLGVTLSKIFGSLASAF